MRARYLLAALCLAGCGGPPSPAAAPEAIVADTGSAEIPRITPSSRQSIPSLMRTAYPELLRDAGVGGSVNARFVVLADGTVDPASIAIIQADDMFRNGAVLALSRLRFTPALADGAPVAARLRAVLKFNPTQGTGTIQFYRPTAPAAGVSPR
ncbi:MAG TPA: TonB family protein [Longimicrobium sp.]|jgi:TonB family protein